MSADGGPEHAGERPTLRIVRGDPTPEELAALVAVLAAASGGRRSQRAGRAGRAVGAACPAHAPGRGADRVVGVVAAAVS